MKLLERHSTPQTSHHPTVGPTEAAGGGGTGQNSEYMGKVIESQAAELARYR